MAKTRELLRISKTVPVILLFAVLSGTYSASAISSDAPTITEVRPFGVTCRINFDYTVTGTTDDGGGRDSFIRVMSHVNTSGEARVSAFFGSDIAVGATETQSSFVLATASQRILITEDVFPFVDVVDDASTAGFVGRTPVRRSDFIAAGGPCADLVANTAPTANAGADFTVRGGDVATLDASASSDPESDGLTYNWSQVSGTPVTLSDPTAISPTFTAPLAEGTEPLVFQLTVRDAVGDENTATVTVTVEVTGTIRIIQRIVGADASVSYISDIAALTGSIATLGGSGELFATNVPAGTHSVTAADLTPQGYALTDITCSDTDSVVDFAGRSVAIELSPAEALICTFTSAHTRDAAMVAIRNFLTGRNGLILANQPDAQRRVSRLESQTPRSGEVSIAGFGVPGSGTLPMNASLGQTSGRFSTSLAQVRSSFSNAAGVDPDRSQLPFDIWAELHFGSAEFDGADYDYQIAYVGADYLATDRLLLGVMGQYDTLDGGARAAGRTEGDGWMVGPYLTTKLSEHLFGDLRAAWGKSANSVSPLGTFTDGFDTNRSLFTGSLVGVFDAGERTRFRPEVSLRYIKEEQDEYRDSLGVNIPSQTVDQGDIAFSPRIDHHFDMDDGWTFKPYASVDGIYTFGASDGSPLEHAVRARIELGGQLYRDGALGISFAANYDGIGAPDFQSSGVLISLSRGF